MEAIICLIFCIITMILFSLIFNMNYKKAKKLEDNSKLQVIIDKFPDNKEIAEEMLNFIGNKDVKIEEAKDTKTSLYIAVTNKIIIADLKDNYGRLLTIAHECIHSIQDRKLLMFNFIFSNFTIIYFIIAVIFTVCGAFTNVIMQAFILLMLALIQFAVRGYLEVDAMTRSKYLAKDYMDNKDVCTKEEKEKVIIEYDKINKIGIPFTLGYLLLSLLIRIVLFLMIGIVFK